MTRVNEDEDVERGVERFGNALMLLAVAIGDRNGGRVRHLPPDGKDASEGVIEGEHLSLGRPNCSRKDGEASMRRTTARAPAPSAIDDGLKDINDARPRMGAGELAA